MVEKALKNKVVEDVNFIKIYNEIGLPFKRVHKHKTDGRGHKQKDTSCHENMGMARQYSKYLANKGLVYKYKTGVIRNDG